MGQCINSLSNEQIYQLQRIASPENLKKIADNLERIDVKPNNQITDIISPPQIENLKPILKISYIKINEEYEFIIGEPHGSSLIINTKNCLITVLNYQKTLDEFIKEYKETMIIHYMPDVLTFLARSKGGIIIMFNLSVKEKIIEKSVMDYGQRKFMNASNDIISKLIGDKYINIDDKIIVMENGFDFSLLDNVILELRTISIYPQKHSENEINEYLTLIDIETNTKFKEIKIYRGRRQYGNYNIIKPFKINYSGYILLETIKIEDNYISEENFNNIFKDTNDFTIKIKTELSNKNGIITLSRDNNIVFRGLTEITAPTPIVIPDIPIAPIVNLRENYVIPPHVVPSAPPIYPNEIVTLDYRSNENPVNINDLPSVPQHINDIIEEKKEAIMV